MDTLTHALSGALIARALPQRFLSVRSRGEEPQAEASDIPERRRMLICAIAAAFPDIDFVANAASPLTYLLNHRGVTHSLVMLPLWALLLSFLAALVFRHPRGWKAYIGVAAIGVLAHITGDLITSFGTMVFSPFSDARYAWGTTFIIDLWFSGIILAGLALSAVWKSSRVPAAAACVLLVAYVGGLQLHLQERALEVGREQARALGWPRAKVSALARAASPFNWTVLVENEGDYRFANINLRATEIPADPGPDAFFVTRMAAHFRPVPAAVWKQASRYGLSPGDIALARDAWEQPDFAFFRWFADYPILLDIARSPASTCVWFHDLRFTNPGVPREPFRYGMCRGSGSQWRAYEMLGRGEKTLVR